MGWERVKKIAKNGWIQWLSFCLFCIDNATLTSYIIRLCDVSVVWWWGLLLQSSEFVGYIDSLHHGKLIGWCCSRQSSDIVECELLFNNISVSSTRADIYREDLMEAGINDGRHGFEFDLKSLDLDALNSITCWPVQVRIVGTDVILPLASGQRFPPFLSTRSAKYNYPYCASFFIAEQKLRVWDESLKFIFDSVVADKWPIPRLLWQHQDDEHNAFIELRYADFAPQEGELQLTFTIDKVVVYSLIFSVVPGAVAGHKAERLIFVGGFQGRPNCRDYLKLALHVTKDIHPSIMLMLSLQALGQFWGLDIIAGVSAKQHISANTPELVTRLEALYDQFWLNFGGTEASADRNLFFIPTMPRDKPKESSSHMQRAVKRQAARNVVYTEILETIKSS